MQKRGDLKLTGLIIALVMDVLFLAYFGIMGGEEPNLNIVIISLSILIGLIIGLFAYWYLAYPPTLIRKKLRTTDSLIQEETIETIKAFYAEIYGLYTRLSEKHRQNFYGRVMKVKEAVEEQLHLEKKLEELFYKANKGLVKERKKVYDELYEIYQRLTVKTKQKHYPRLVQLREGLERGRI